MIWWSCVILLFSRLYVLLGSRVAGMTDPLHRKLTSGHLDAPCLALVAPHFSQALWAGVVYSRVEARLVSTLTLRVVPLINRHAFPPVWSI